MIRFHQNTPLKRPVLYSLESYEPVSLKPEEEKQNYDYIKMAFLHTSPNTEHNIPKMFNINNDPNYNTHNLINKKLNFDDPLNEANLYKKRHNNSIYSFGNLTDKKPTPVLNHVKINPMPIKTINKINITKPLTNQNPFNIVKNPNVPLLNVYYQNAQPGPQLVKYKSSKYIKPHQFVHNKTMNVANTDKIYLPMKIKHLSPPKIVPKNPFNSSKQVIPIYRKYVLQRKHFN